MITIKNKPNLLALQNTCRFLKKAVLYCAAILLIGTNNTWAQVKEITLSGKVVDSKNEAIPYAYVLLKIEKDSSFVAGTITDDKGRFILKNVKPNGYYLEYKHQGYRSTLKPIYIGASSAFLEMPVAQMETNTTVLQGVTITSKTDDVNAQLDRKTYTVADNIAQSGGSVLQVMQNLPGITAQEGKILLRGSDKVAILIDGKQTALTGVAGQNGLDNIPASSIERIEIINDPSAKYDANGNAGIINIIFKTEKKNGFNGKYGLATGLGALWIKRQNLPSISPQYQNTPKVNPSLFLNYRKDKVNMFLQGDYLYTETLNKNEFVTRTYDNGTAINQQTKRNRNTGFTTVKTGFDYQINAANSVSVSGLFGLEKIIDRGEEPFYNKEITQMTRLWKFLEDELKTTAMATATFSHAYNQPGHEMKVGFNYTFHREDEKYFFTNINPTFTGNDAFKLISDEQIADATLDYTKPLKNGRLEAGAKLRWRNIPTNMLFIPGLNSPLDTNAGGQATYQEIIPALYGSYIFESKKYEAEIGLRLEYVNLNYYVNPNHNTYQSDGYAYAQPFPNMRMAYKINDNRRISFFYNRRVDRPNEVDIRIFPKYDDAEIIKVGNPALKRQFAQTIEIGYKTSYNKGYLYIAAYQRFIDATITRIATTVPGSTLIYNVFQNAARSSSTGAEAIWSSAVNNVINCAINLNAYYNAIDAFTVVNLYPIESEYNAAKQTIYSGNIKLNASYKIKKAWLLQGTFTYLAPDIIPQGTIAQRYAIDLGLKRNLLKGKSELYINATDVANTMVIRKQINGTNFSYNLADYNETQVIRIGYNHKF